MSGRRFVKAAIKVLGWLIGVGFLLIFWQQIVNNGTEWQRIIADTDWWRFALATIILVVGMGVWSQLSYISQHELRYPFTRLQAHHAWFMSLLGKYIPGAIWMYAARAVFYRRSGMPGLLVTAVMAWEMLSTVVAGLMIGLSGIFVIDNHDWSVVIVGGSFVLIVCFVISLMLLPWRLLAKTRLFGTERIVQILTNLGSQRFRLLWRLSLLALVTWLIIGTGFYVLTTTLLDPGTVPFWYAVVTFVVAWIVGFLILIAPSGLGPREAVIIMLLTPYCGFTLALSIALFARIWWTLSEVIHVLAASMIQLSPRLAK